MKSKVLKYDHEKDFIRIRDFLKKNYYAFDKPRNWGLERWNWGRYHPMMFQEKNPSETKKRIGYFEESIRIWEDDRSEILAVVSTESPHKDGEIFFQQSPGCEFLYDEMFEFAQSALMNPEDKTLRMAIYEYDNKLIDAARAWGFTKQPDSLGHASEYIIKERPPINLPNGFTLLSMKEGASLAGRCQQMGLGFDHKDPGEWTTPAEYEEVQKAPDYRPDLDLVTVSPGGDYASGCILWYDDYNNIGYFEPVCTVPEYRRMGLGREVMMEGIRRISDLGATKAYVGSSQEFYKSIGFNLKYATYEWVKQL